MILVTVNGQERRLEGATGLLGYLDTLEVDINHIAVALNGTVLRRDELGGVTLSDGDSVEIVRAVGGG